MEQIDRMAFRVFVFRFVFPLLPFPFSFSFLEIAYSNTSWRLLVEFEFIIGRTYLASNTLSYLGGKQHFS